MAKAELELKVTTTFICGLPRDHKCDDDGEQLCGGTHEDGTHWSGPVSNIENQKRASWGSVSCSVCGLTAMERSYWEN